MENLKKEKKELLKILVDVLNCFYFEIHYPSIFIAPKSKMSLSVHTTREIENIFRKALETVAQYKETPRNLKYLLPEKIINIKTVS